MADGEIRASIPGWVCPDNSREHKLMLSKHTMSSENQVSSIVGETLDQKVCSAHSSSSKVRCGRFCSDVIELREERERVRRAYIPVATIKLSLVVDSRASDVCRAVYEDEMILMT